ncbi:hypothetical protein pb186bvf_005438 [Paramecium bursaria]
MECLICLESSKLVILDCKHPFCQGCLKQGIQNKLNFNQDPLVCPHCSIQINQDILQKSCGVEFFSHVNEEIFKKNLIKPQNDNEMMITCLEVKCKAQFFIWKDSDYYTCFQCRNKFCLKCNSRFHEGLTCRQNQLKQIYTISTIKLRKAEIESGSKECPFCCCLIQRSAGCQIMTCHSVSCKGKNKFCYTCLTKFTDTGYSHFQDRDSYKGKCLVTEIDQKQPNKVPCPGCKTLDPYICQIEKNFCENICTCNICKKILCLNCGSKITDLNYLLHMEQKCQIPQPQPKKSGCIIQ